MDCAEGTLGCIGQLSFFRVLMVRALEYKQLLGSRMLRRTSTLYVALLCMSASPGSM